MSVTNDPIDVYLRRFAEVALTARELDPTRTEERQAIRRTASDCLGIRDDWMPGMRVSVVAEHQLGHVTVQCLVAESWPGVTATAHLFLPTDFGDGPHPVVLLCCGHGKGGKLAAGYQSMARHLAGLGAMVLCHDNIGQGERTPMGHRDVVGPFAAGMSLQGLIVMEAMAWLDWLKVHPRADASRSAAIGNSGGGTLTTFLAGLRDDMASISSSGYPCTFDFIARKEKKHCHCNILPGIVGRLDMWQLLGCTAPRPLLVFQGIGDPLFPPDLFHHVCRRITAVYRQCGVAERFRGQLMPGVHPWDAARIDLVGEFLVETLGLPGKPRPATLLDAGAADSLTCLTGWPDDALNADQVAEQITGRRCEPGLELWDVFPPKVPEVDKLENTSLRGETRQILAQFEAFLAGQS